MIKFFLLLLVTSTVFASPKDIITKYNFSCDKNDYGIFVYLYGGAGSEQTRVISFPPNSYVNFDLTDRRSDDGGSHSTDALFVGTPPSSLFVILYGSDSAEGTKIVRTSLLVNAMTFTDGRSGRLDIREDGKEQRCILRRR